MDLHVEDGSHTTTRPFWTTRLKVNFEIVKTRYIAAKKYRKQNTKGPVENSAISQN